jgi:hypothetical protein
MNHEWLRIAAGGSEQGFAQNSFNFLVGYWAAIEIPDGTAAPVDLLKCPPALVQCFRRASSPGAKVESPAVLSRFHTIQ